MANNTTMQVTDPTTGKTFTPAEAKGRAQKAAAMSILRTNFFNEHGMGNYSKQLLAKYAFQKMYDVDNKIMAASLKQDDINSSFQEQTQITSAFEANKDLGGFIHSLSTTVDEDGNPLGMQGAWKYAMNHIKKMVLAGNLSIPDLEVIREQAMPGMGGKTFGELHATKFDTIVLEVTRAKQTRFSMMQQEAKNEWLTREAEIIAALGPNPTIEEIELGNEALLSVPGWSRRSASLDQIASTLSVEAKQEKKAKEIADSFAKAGLLNPTWVRDNLPYSLWAEYMPIAQSQDNVKQSDDYKTERNALIELEIGRASCRERV